MFEPDGFQTYSINYGHETDFPDQNVITWFQFVSIVDSVIRDTETPACMMTRYMLDDISIIRGDINYSENEQYAWYHIGVNAFRIWATAFMTGRETLFSEPSQRRMTIVDSLLCAASSIDIPNSTAASRIRTSLAAWTDADRAMVEEAFNEEIENMHPGLMERRNNGRITEEIWKDTDVFEIGQLLYARIHDYNDQRHFYPLSRREIEMILEKFQHLQRTIEQLKGEVPEEPAPDDSDDCGFWEMNL